LDCPDANHTSPLSKLFIIIVSPLEYEKHMFKGSRDALGFFNESCRLPSEVVIASTDSVFHEDVALTIVPETSHPKSLISVFCWITALSPIIEANLRLLPKIGIKTINNITKKTLNLITLFII
jgi:hypothetical protein